MIKRIQTGINGLDEVLGGGIPEGFMMLVSGQCGAGKTILGLQFLCNSHDTGIFVTFEESIDNIRETANTFGIDVKRLEASGRLRILKYDPYKFEDIFDIIENNIRETAAKRIVIDSISAMGIYVHDPSELRRVILHAGAIMKKYGCTSLLLSEIIKRGEVSRFGVEEFVCDGVMILENVLGEEGYERRLHVMKLRLNDHSRKVHRYEIGKSGIMLK